MPKAWKQNIVLEPIGYAGGKESTNGEAHQNKNFGSWYSVSLQSAASLTQP